MAKKKTPTKKNGSQSANRKTTQKGTSKPAPKKATSRSSNAKKSASKPKTSKSTKSNKASVKKEGKIIDLGIDQEISNIKDLKIRFPAEELHKVELLALSQNDTYPKPPNWKLSPKMVEIFIVGSEEEFKYKIKGKEGKTKISTKYFGDKNIIQKAIVTLASERALMLIGEPGTAKSWLSEHLAAATSGISTYLIQGTAGTTEDQIRYSWNYALLVSEGPSPKSLVPSPTINAMREGKILRFEELTRCPQEIQDSMISILSEKVVPVPELGSEHLIFGIPGFNVIATANDRDRGVNEMSAALKRRFNFIYIPVVQDKTIERKIVLQRTNDLLTDVGFKIQLPEDTLDLLVTVFQELRTGKSAQGGRFSPISSVMSTSEEISLLFDSAIYAKFFDKKKVEPKHVAMNLIDAVVKDNKENLPKLKEYFNIVANPRGRTSNCWNEFNTTLRRLI